MGSLYAIRKALMSSTGAKTTLSKRLQFTAPEILLQLDAC